MKRGKTDIKLTTKKSLKPQELKKIKIKLKSKVYNRLALKHNSSCDVFSEKLLDSLIYNKNTHLSVAFRDNMIMDFTEEFLKRYLLTIF